MNKNAQVQIIYLQESGSKNSIVITYKTPNMVNMQKVLRQGKWAFSTEGDFSQENNPLDPVTGNVDIEKLYNLILESFNMDYPILEAHVDGNSYQEIESKEFGSEPTIK